MTNFFWYMPDWVKTIFKPKGKTTLSITAYKDGDEWYFNKFPITWKESLVFKEALDHMAQGKSKMKIFISTQQFPGAEVMSWYQADPCWMEANEYTWKGFQIWICPWSQWYWGFVPEQMYFTVEGV